MEDLKKIQEFFSKPLNEVSGNIDIEDFAKVVQAISQTNHPVTVLLTPMFGKNEIELVIGMDAPDPIGDAMFDIMQDLGYKRGDFSIVGDTSTLSRREYSQIRRVNGGHKDYQRWEESVNENALGFNDSRLSSDQHRDLDYAVRGDSAYTFGNDPYADDQLRYKYAVKMGFLNEAQFTDYSNNELASYCKNNPTDKKAAKELHKRSQALKGLTRTDEGKEDRIPGANHLVPSKSELDSWSTDKAYTYLGLLADKAYNAQTQNKEQTLDSLSQASKAISNYFNIEESINEGAVEIMDAFNDVMDLVKKHSRNLSDDDSYALALKLKAWFNKNILDEATKEEETEFHTKLDKLVHDTFGKRKSEMEENMSLDDQAKAYYLEKLKKGEIDTLPEDPKAAFLNQMTKDQMDHDEETLRRERGLEETSAYIAETIKLGLMVNEELCEKGKRYIKARQAAGEKSSAYLSGRAVRVCKGQIEWPKKEKKK